MTKPVQTQDTATLSIEDKLKYLYQLQLIDSKIDQLKMLHGELPLEVQDLEDDITGLETRIQNFENDIKQLNNQIAEKKTEILNSQALIKKYEAQQMNVRNNREFDALSKEMEFQHLEIELFEKRIREYTASIDNKNQIIKESTELLEERKQDLQEKKAELEEIIKENSKDEQDLISQVEAVSAFIDARTLNAYYRIRNNARNGLAVVTVERDACGGCFAKIPPQRQLDIRSRKKIIPCEFCGRILVDKGILGMKEGE
ncbi:MAG: hypothetical protein KBB11_07935 [Bacteroidales bacterium]|nr:hypothetical protein [Bacteroidales bacterium]